MSKLVNDFEEECNVSRTGASCFFTTGCTLLNKLVAGGFGANGLSAGRIIHFMGESGAGKTFFACELISSAYHQYKDKLHWLYDDSETGFSFYNNSKKLWGIDIRKPDDTKSSTVEELYYNVRKFLRELKEGEKGIYIVDSLDALSNDDYEEIADARMKAGDKGQTYDKGSYGMSAQKFLSQEFFRKISKELEEKDSLLVFVSQYRDNVNAGMYGEKRRVSGGSALKFYCDTEIALKVKEKFVKNDLHYGSCIEANLVKSKTDRPNRKCYINILFDYGIDDISSNIDYLFDLKSPDTGKLGSNTTCNMGDASDPRYGKYDLTLDGLKQMMTDEGLYDTAVEDLKDAGIKRTKDGYINWLKERHEDIFKAYYGEPIERDELIALADKDKSVRKMLKERVIAKWEAAEAAVASNRSPKYSSDDDEY